MTGSRSIAVLAAVAVVFLLDIGQPFFVPLLIAILIAYALAPLVRGLTFVLRLRVVAAALVSFSLVALAGVGTWALADDAEELLQRLPAAARNMAKSVQKVSGPGGPVAEVTKVAKEVESIGNDGKPPAKPAPPAATPTWQMLWKGGMGVVEAGAQVMSVFFLVFFMLASGDLFKRKLMRLGGEKLVQRHITEKVIDEVDLQIRRYLGVLAISSLLTGALTGLAFRALGLEHALLWGVAAGILNTAPYFGPAAIAVASLFAAFVQFDGWTMAFAVAGSSVAVQALVGSLFETWFASRQARMNATATFVGLLFFSWIWGLWGLLLAIPLLAIVKTICDHDERLRPVGELLGR